LVFRHCERHKRHQWTFLTCIDTRQLKQERETAISALSSEIVQLWDELDEAERPCPDCKAACQLEAAIHTEQVRLCLLCWPMRQANECSPNRSYPGQIDAERMLSKQRIVKYEAALETLKAERVWQYYAYKTAPPDPLEARATTHCIACCGQSDM
jgi:hypothetical protein